MLDTKTMLSNSKAVNTSEDKKKKTKYASFRVSQEKFDIKL